MEEHGRTNLFICFDARNLAFQMRTAGACCGWDFNLESLASSQCASSMSNMSMSLCSCRIQLSPKPSHEDSPEMHKIRGIKTWQTPEQSVRYTQLVIAHLATHHHRPQVTGRSNGPRFQDNCDAVTHATSSEKQLLLSAHLHKVAGSQR